MKISTTPTGCLWESAPSYTPRLSHLRTGEEIVEEVKRETPSLIRKKITGEDEEDNDGDNEKQQGVDQIHSGPGRQEVGALTIRDRCS